MTSSRQPPADVKPDLAAAEARLFARYGVDPLARALELHDPPLALRIREVGSGEPALLLHGITLGAVHWAPLMARLSSRCIAIDMPGHGGSDSVDFTGVDLRRWHVTMLANCLDSLGLRSAHLIGHSYGAMFALWLAHDAPGRVRSVTAIGTPAVAFGARPDAALRMLAWPGIGRLSLALPSPPPVYRRILAVSIGHPALAASPPELVPATYLSTRRPGLARTVSTYLREQFRGARARPPRYVLDGAELARIRQPVLVIWGDHDYRYQPIAEAQRRAALIPGARFELVPGGHEPWLDDPEGCGKLIADFLSVASPPTSEP